MKRRRLHPNRRRPADRLLRIALRHWEGDKCWEAVHELRRRASPATLALVLRLFTSPSWRRRALAVNIAAQFHRRAGDGQRDLIEYAPDETRQLLLAGLLDPREEVMAAAAVGLGHRPFATALPQLARLAVHPNVGIRYGVSFALGSYGEAVAIDALLALAGDPDDRVRDWATFGLGTLHDADTPAVRDRLWTNLQDACPDVRGEAIVGLARRKDPRALDYLLGRLGPDCCTLDLEAAGMLASPLLLPSLEQLAASVRSDSVDWLMQLQVALHACTPGQEPGAE